LIPVKYASADQVAEVVRQVFANRLANLPGQQRQPSPEEFIRALRGGRGGGGDNNDRRAEQERQLTVGVDTRSNQLVVTAPDELFMQVRALVEQLDQEDSDFLQTTRVVTLREANPAMVQKAIATIVGQTTTTTSSSSTTQPPGQPGQNGQERRGEGDNRGRGDGDGARQQAEFFRALQQGAGGGPGREGFQGGRRGGRGGGGDFGGRGGGDFGGRGGGGRGGEGGRR
jgi:hypothetical protein